MASSMYTFPSISRLWRKAMTSRTVTMGNTWMPYCSRSSLMVVVSPVPRYIRSTETMRAVSSTSATCWKSSMVSRTAVPAVTTSSTMTTRSPALGW